MFKGISYTHVFSVTIFLLIYVIKTILLLANNENALTKFTKATRVFEMIISTLFLVTGIYLLTQIPEIKSMLIIKIVIVFASIPLAVIGFKKKNKALAVISLLMIIAAYGLAEMSKKQGSAKMETAPAAGQGLSADGQQLYSTNCAKCHGDDGKLGITGAADLSVSAMDPNVKVEIVKNGKGTMPAFAGQLNDEQIGAVVGYIQTLKK